MIKLQNVRFAYPEASARPALNIPNWSVAAKERVFVHGPSGCGKSTFLNVLSGMLAITQGEISILDERLDAMNRRARDRFRANHIGYVFQQFNLIPYLNALDNIQLAAKLSHSPGKSSSMEDTKRLLAELNISGAEWKKPSSRLSVGQQQRVAIARALINKPELLIADEPTSSLDYANRDNFMSVLVEQAKAFGATLVFVSHDLSLADYFDRVEAFSAINQEEDIT